MKDFFYYIQKKYVFFSLVIIAITIPLAFFSSKQKFFNNIEVYFEKNDPIISKYNNVRKKYGNEETVIIAFESKNLFTNENLGLIRNLTDKFKTIQGVSRVYSITNAEIVTGKDDVLTFDKIIPEKNLSQQEINKARKRVLETGYLKNRIISGDGKLTAIQIELEPFKDDSAKKEVLENIRTKLDEINNKKLKSYLAGLPFIESEMNNLSEKDFTILIPLIFLTIFLFVHIIIKKIWLSILCMVNLFFCLIWGIGFLSLNGEPFNIVTTFIPVIILAIAVADTIHIIAHFKEHGYNEQGIIQTIKSLWFPCLITTITTCIGFFSFYTSSVRPVKVLGIFTGSAIVFAYILTITFLPSLFLIFKNKLINSSDEPGEEPNTVKDKKSIISTSIIEITSFAIKHHKFVSAIIIILIISGIAGIRKIYYETNVINFLPQNNIIKQNHNYVSDKFIGTIPLILIIKAKSPEHDFNNPQSLRLINDIQQNTFKKYKKISNSFSIADYYKEMNIAFNNNDKNYNTIPENRESILEYYELGDPEVLDRILSADKMETRILAQMKLDTNENAKKLIKKIENYANSISANKFECKVTGIASIYVDMVLNLQDSQIKSFATAFLIISMMMTFLCRNFKLSIIAIVVNLLPIILTIGLMGWLQIPMDVSTIMIASITMGIAVDDTIHFITWFKKFSGEGHPLKESIKMTITEAGKPIFITTVILFFSFFLFILGSMSSTRAFGVLTAFSIMIALLGDILVLPALLTLFKYKTK